MKKFIMGLGTGFIMASITLGVIYISRKPEASQQTLTDEQIISRARQLGMITYTELPQSRNYQETEALTEETLTEETQTQDSQNEIQPEEISGSGKISVVITDNMKAGDICRLLAEKDVINDYDRFYEYIINKKATKRLLSGKYEFEKNLSDELVFNILTGG